MSSKSGSDDENISPDTPPKKKSKNVGKHRSQKFREAWLSVNEFRTWLAKVPGDPSKAKCTACSVNFRSELTVIKNHSKSQSHQQKLLPAQPKIVTFLKHVEKSTDNEASKKLEIKLCAFLVDHNISFRALDHLTPLLKECVTDSAIVKGMQLKSTKGAAIITNVIGDSERDDLCQKLKSSFFSVLIDECTDIAAVKTMCIIVRFFDAEEGRVVSKFWDLCQIFNESTNAHSATAEHLFGLLTHSLQCYDIPFANIIGFASDGCSTMMGSKNSVASRFIEKCPGIYIFKCICHSLHLCASEACKELPRGCEALARNVYNEFKNSAKRLSHFQEFQKFLDVEVHKILRPSQTRWLSLRAVVRILEQWDALKLYFREQMLTVRLHSVEQIVQALDNPIIKLFYLFLEWVLPKFTKLNELFQSQSVILTTLYSKMTMTYQELLESYLCKPYIYQTSLKDIDLSNEGQRLRPEQTYFGVKVMDMLSKPELHNNERLKLDFQATCVKFLVVGCCQIKQRFNFDDPLLLLVSNLNPTKAMFRKTRDAVPSLLPLMKIFPRIVASEQYQDIDDEWRQLPYFELPEDIDVKDKVDIFWAKLMACDGDDQGLTFKKLSKFVLDVISLPHANADCERLFSQVNLIKTKTRNKLVTPTVSGILLAKQRVQGNCVNFEPSAKEYSRMIKARMYPKERTAEEAHSTIDLYKVEELSETDDIVIPNNF